MEEAARPVVTPSVPFTAVPSIPIASASVPLAFGQPEGMTSYVTTATLSSQHPIYAASAEGLANGGLITSAHAMAPVYDAGDGSRPYPMAGSPLSPLDERGNPNTKKNAWTAEEDLTLARIVEECGPGRWTKVAQQLPGRMGKQCRERWFNHLAPEVKKGEWTAEEDRLIMTSVRDHGTRWSHIVKLLPGRSDNAIKNRYYSAVRKAHRQDQRLCAADKPMTSVAAASPLAEAAVVSAAEEAHALAAGTPPPQLALALPPEESAAHLQAWQAAQRGVELRHSQPALAPPPPAAAEGGGPSPSRGAGRGKGSPARPKGSSPAKRKRKAEAEEEEDEEEAPAAAPAGAPQREAPPLLAAAAPTPPLVMAELPPSQTVHMSGVHLTHTPLALHSTSLPPNLASAGGQVTLGMPAGYAHTSCAPGACHSAAYSKGGGAKPEGAP